MCGWRGGESSAEAPVAPKIVQIAARPQPTSADVQDFIANPPCPPCCAGGAGCKLPSGSSFAQERLNRADTTSRLVPVYFAIDDCGAASMQPPSYKHREERMRLRNASTVTAA